MDLNKLLKILLCAVLFVVVLSFVLRCCVAVSAYHQINVDTQRSIQRFDSLSSNNH